VRNVGKRRTLLSRIFGKRKSPELTEALEDLPADTITSQKSVGTENPAFFLPQDKIIIPPFDLIEYLNLYLTNSLAKSLIDATTNLVVSPIECISESDDLCKYIDDFNRRIELDSMVLQLTRDMNIFGYGLCEVVGNAPSLLDSTEVLGLKLLDPRFILIQVDQRGHYKFFRQRPGLLRNALSVANVQNTSFPLSFDRPLDPMSIIFVRNHSPLTTYGHSLLQSLKERLTQRDALIDASVLAARNHANAVLLLQYLVDPQIPEDAKEVNKQTRAMRKQVLNVDKGKSRWLVAGGYSEWRTSLLGHSTIPDSTPLLDRLTTDIIVSANLSPSQMGFSMGTRGVNQNDPSARMTINSIVTKQRNLVQQLQNKLYRILPLIEPVPSGEIIVRMQEPTAETAKAKAEEQTIKINNVILQGKSGLLSGRNAARELGYADLEDQEKWDAMTEPQMDQVNPNDPNNNQAVKAAIDSTTKGNNPSGKKGI